MWNSLPAYVVMAATVNQFKHEFDQYFTYSKQKYHFESDIYEYFFLPHVNSTQYHSLRLLEIDVKILT